MIKLHRQGQPTVLYLKTIKRKLDNPIAVHKYEILDYVTTNQNQLVYTGVRAKNGITVEMTTKITERPGNTRYFSTYDSTDYSGQNAAFATGVWGLQFESTTMTIKPLGADGNSVSSGFATLDKSYSYVYNQKLRYSLSCAGILNIYNDDDTLNYTYDCSSKTDLTKVSNTDIVLFGRIDSQRQEFYVGDTYNIKIYDGNSLIRHYIPVKRLEDNKIGLYEEISGTFKTNESSSYGTYEFTGTSKATPEYIDEYISGVQTINKIFNKGEVYWGNPRPPLYEILEYIIVPSQSCIGTGLKADYNTIVEMTANIPIPVSGGPRLFSTKDSAWNSPGTWGLSIENNNKIVVFPLGYSGNIQVSYNLQANIDYTFRFTGSGMYYLYSGDTLLNSYDATSYTTQSTMSNTNIQLFCFRDGHEYLTNGTKVYSCNIWSSTDLVRHYIPVKRLSDNAIGFYDNVNNTFQENEISGYSFTGVSKSTPEYI